MNFSETQLQFFHVLERLRKIDWGKQFQVLKPPEFCALSIIYTYHKEHPEIPGIYVSAFAERLRVSLPAASKMLKHLEGQGWLTRMVDKNNRRNTFIVLTEEGAALFQQEQAHCAASSERILTRLGEENTNLLLRTVNQTLDLVEEEFNRTE
jgi:DNA-binding MarR family transcriptional regulator